MHRGTLFFVALTTVLVCCGKSVPRDTAPAPTAVSSQEEPALPLASTESPPQAKGNAPEPASPAPSAVEPEPAFPDLSAVQPGPVQVFVETITSKVPNTDVAIRTHHVRVAGMSDPAAQQRLNDALKAPVDEWVRTTSKEVPEQESFIRNLWNDPDNPHHGLPPRLVIRSDANIRMCGPALLSVRYHHSLVNAAHASWDWSNTVFNIDLRTGQELADSDIFSPETLTEEGMATLSARLWPSGRKPCAVGEERLPLKMDALQVAFTRNEAEFTITLPALGYANACGVPTVVLPLAKVANFLRPQFIALLSAASASTPAKRGACSNGQKSP
jgi:serine/threonine-protein kinase